MKTTNKREGMAWIWVSAVALWALAAFAVANAQTVGVTAQMSTGDTGAQVSALQTFLAADGTIYPEGLVTGFYGELTTAAVQRYQCKNGIVCSGDVISTGYGRVGPVTLGKIETQQGTNAGGGVSSVADVDAPILSAPTVTVSRTSAAIHWTTSERANSRVMYARTPPTLDGALVALMPGVSDPSFDTSSDVTLTGLQPNTTYYYILQSIDLSGNVQYGIGYSFRTNP